MDSMATSTMVKHVPFEAIPITLKSDVAGKVSLNRNHCVRMGNVVQFSVVLGISTAYNADITDSGAVPIPKTFDTTVAAANAVIDTHCNDGRLRITRDGRLTLSNITETGSYLFNTTYIAED
jgi:hypothetical protein